MAKVWRRNTVDVGLIPEIDIARLAAFLDGEGCLQLTPSGKNKGKNRYLAIRVVIGQADVRLMEYLFNVFGGRYSQGQGGTNRPMYYWMTESVYACSLLKRCLPYFIMKGEQAQILIDYNATVSMNNQRPLPVATVSHRETLKSRLTLLKHPERAAG